MKKYSIIIVICCLFILTSCGAKTQSLKEFYNDEGIEQIEKVVITDGSTGYSKTIENEVIINEFIALISDIQFTPQEDQSKRDGFRYGITLHDGDTTFNFSLKKIGKYYYNSTPDIHPIVDQFYQNLNTE